MKIRIIKEHDDYETTSFSVYLVIGKQSFFFLKNPERGNYNYIDDYQENYYDNMVKLVAPFKELSDHPEQAVLYCNSKNKKLAMVANMMVLEKITLDRFRIPKRPAKRPRS